MLELALAEVSAQEPASVGELALAAEPDLVPALVSVAEPDLVPVQPPEQVAALERASVLAQVLHSLQWNLQTAPKVSLPVLPA